jgi:alkanesulfonate monooxygenase SsuD/methylene tetrahydromethanopterin reductase-like flavin-dependent oxidoreductase (luciferase family)
MRVGLVLPMATSDAERILRFARRAEELGFDGLFGFDHLFPPGAPADRPSFEAFATLGAVAASTERVTIGTLVARASMRAPGLLAKAATTLDDVSGGRFVLAIGTGDAVSGPEHAAFGLPSLGADVRRAHLAETVGAVHALFRGVPFAGGAHVPPIPGPLLPPPARAGGPPVWIGGASESAARLAGRLADGWNGWALDLPSFASRAAAARSEAWDRPFEVTWAGAAVVGRDAGDAERAAADRRDRGIVGDAFVGPPEAAAAWLDALAAAGASWAILLAAGGLERAELIAERVLPRVTATAPA